MKYLGLILLTFLFSQIGFSQVVLDQKEAERIARESAQEMRISKQYFTAHDKCHELVKQKNYARAEVSCRLAVSLSEKLPDSRSMEKHSAYKWLGLTLIWQRKNAEAIPILEKSLTVAKNRLDETNAETGEVYFLIGQANHLLRNIKTAGEFYKKAEKVYLAAIAEICEANSDDEICSPYSRAIENIRRAHQILLKNADLEGVAKRVNLRSAPVIVKLSKIPGNWNEA